MENRRPCSKKNEVKPHLKECWCIPPEQNAAFVAQMEEVLDVYCLPYDPAIPQVCMDEHPRQLVQEVRAPLPSKPGQPARYDYEYERKGTAALFLFTEPLAGWRHVSVREHRTSIDWALEIKEVLEMQYPQAEKVRLVCDNLNTHTKASLYKAFPPEEARRLAQRLEFHYTPKHGSWLNLAECELSALTRQGLDRRIPDLETLRRETASWEHHRNANQKGVDWRFTTEEARIKLKRLYPQIQMS